MSCTAATDQASEEVGEVVKVVEVVVKVEAFPLSVAGLCIWLETVDGVDGCLLRLYDASLLRLSLWVWILAIRQKVSQ